MTYLKMGLNENTPTRILFSETGNFLTGMSLFRTPDKVKYNNLDFVIMQYTGFLDKKGEEIYESDIVKDERGRKLLVFWNEETGCWQFGDVKLVYFSNPRFWVNKLIEVVGDIYRNPKMERITG